MYDNLVVGNVYYGKISSGDKYFFKYLGNGQWSCGTNKKTPSELYSNTPWPKNTNDVLVLPDPTESVLIAGEVYFTITTNNSSPRWRKYFGEDQWGRGFFSKADATLSTKPMLSLTGIVSRVSKETPPGPAFKPTAVAKKPIRIIN